MNLIDRYCSWRDKRENARAISELVEMLYEERNSPHLPARDLIEQRREVGLSVSAFNPRRGRALIRSARILRILMQLPKGYTPHGGHSPWIT